jgi:hypothetical protein
MSLLEMIALKAPEMLSDIKWSDEVARPQSATHLPTRLSTEPRLPRKVPTRSNSQELENEIEGLDSAPQRAKSGNLSSGMPETAKSNRETRLGGNRVHVIRPTPTWI